MEIYRLNEIKDKKLFLKKLDIDKGGIPILSNKMDLYYFFIKNLSAPAVNILKQDALSIGANLATPSGAIVHSQKTFDCLLIGTKKHIKILSKKELSQSFELNLLAKELKESLDEKKYELKIMGIINANDDSFFSGSRFLGSKAINECKKMIVEGANILDIGAVSSKPNADIVSEKDELERIKPICDTIKKEKLYEKTIFSIDSYTPSVVEYALRSGFSIINDITGARDDKLIELAIKYNAKICIMHMQGTPQDMQKNPQYDDVMINVSQFFEEQITKCEHMGLNRENIILDVGIGFGKTLEHNTILIRNMSHFKKFKCEILIGASRKSLIDKIIATPIEKRLAGSLAIHLKGIDNGATIIRCHDIIEHKQAISVWNVI